MPRLAVVPIIVVMLLAACGRSPQQQEPATAPADRNPAEGGGQQTAGTPKETDGMSATRACYKVDAGDKAVLESQTFAIDFEPFKGSCFVTTHDPRYKDPPLGSEIAIYRDGKDVFVFPMQFNGVSVGCWVEAVSFQDVDLDGRKDIIVVGKCGGKMGDFNENTVYMNNGTSFVTDEEFNRGLNDLTTVKEISAYVNKNPPRLSSGSDASNSDRKP